MANWPVYNRGSNGNQNLQLWLSLLNQVGKTAESIGSQWHQDSAANQAMNTQIPPRAALVDAYPGDGTAAENNADFTAENPQVPTSGSAPFTGGKAGMAAYLQLHNSQLNDQKNQLNQQYRLQQMQQMSDRQGNSMDRINLAREKLQWQQDQADQKNQTKANAISPSDARALEELGAANTFSNNYLGVSIDTAIKYAKNWQVDPNNPNVMRNDELAKETGKPVVIPKTLFDNYSKPMYQAGGTLQYFKAHNPDLLKNAGLNYGQSLNNSAVPPATVASDQQVLQPNVAGSTGKQQHNSQMTGDNVVQSILPQQNQATPQAPVPQATPDVPTSYQ
jgi:hypothetical protein